MNNANWVPKTIDWTPMHDVLIRDEDGTIRHTDEPFFANELLAPETWMISSDGDRSYLFAGDEMAVVVDSGYGSGDLREYCQNLANKPVHWIINTHEHFDHTANNCYFDKAFMSAEAVPYATVPFPSFLKVTFPRDYPIEVVDNGSIIDLGGRQLEIIKIPDHSDGSIAILDKKQRIVIIGDELTGNGTVKVLRKTVESWDKSLHRLLEKKDLFDWAFNGGGNRIPVALLEEHLVCAEKVLAGEPGQKDTRGGHKKEEKSIREEDDDTEFTEGEIYDRFHPRKEDDSGPHADTEKRLEMTYKDACLVYSPDRIYNKTCLKVGAGEGTVYIPEEVFPMYEPASNAYYTGVHDEPKVRVLLLDHLGQKFAYVCSDIVGLEPDMISYMHQQLLELTGISPSNIWLAATHTVSTPHLMKKDEDSTQEKQKKDMIKKSYLKTFDEALDIAIASLSDAKVGYGCGTCAVNINSAIETNKGWWLGSGEEGPVDRSVPVIRFDSEDGKPLAILYNYACELAIMDQSVMSDGGIKITADLAGSACDFVEKELGCPVIFLPGVSADQGPIYRSVYTQRLNGGQTRQVDLSDNGWLLLELLGQRLGEQVLVVAEKIDTEFLYGPLFMNHQIYSYMGQKMTKPRDLHPTKEWSYEVTGEVFSPMEIFVIGDICLLSVGEVACRTAKLIKDDSPFQNTIIVTNIDGQVSKRPDFGRKCIVEEDYYDRITYQSRNSGFARGSAEKLYTNAIDFLNNQHHDQIDK